MNDKIKKDGETAGPFQEDGGLVTLSLDFDAYFPSLEKCASIAKESIENSSTSVNCDTKEISLFIHSWPASL